LSPAAAQGLDLVVAVHLVAGEVEEYEDGRPPEPYDIRYDALVGLEDRHVAAGGDGEGRGDAVVEVGAVGVGHDAVRTDRGAYGRGEQVRRGRLAVGAGNAGDRAAWEEVGQGVRRELHQELAADGGTGASARDTRGGASEASRGECDSQTSPYQGRQPVRAAGDRQVGGHVAHSG
jgi:hypothetical protein